MLSVIKATGKKEPYSEEKVINSIRRARIPQTIQHDVLQHVNGKVYDGISSDEIYHHILEFLDTSPHPYAKSRYSLKEAIMQLGPTGYPFEDFVAELLKAIGYETQVRQILLGRCVSHEIDIVASKDGKRHMVEAKFHNNAGTRSEVHVALYTQARFQDIRDKYSMSEAWIVTNTKTTSDANVYAQCTGMKVISWSYPDKGSLREIIEQTKLHPVTILTSLSESNKITLLENHVVLCKQIHENSSLLDRLPLTKEEKEKTKAEVAFICAEEET
jgi:hypothetical protein